MTYYYYKLVTDNGGAPCVHDDVLSLAICKAQIRSTAGEGDWIFGFGGRSTIGERLIYIAEISNKVPNGDYYRNERFGGRPDRIYEWHGDRLRWKTGSLFHQDGEEAESDIGSPPYTKAAVLLSNNFRYFGAAGTEDYRDSFPAISEAITNLGRGHRVNHPEELEQELGKLHQHIWSHHKVQKIGEPTESDKGRRCNRTEGDVQRGSC